MKVTIVGGAGGIGASVAFNLLLRGDAYDVVLLDRRPEMITSHVMDLEQVLVLGGARSVRAGDDADLLDADVVVVSAAVPLTLNTSRMVYLHDNAAIVGGAVDRIASAGPDWGGVLLVVTNPVDPLCTWVVERYGLDRRRVVGYTLNDSLRLRSGLGLALDADPKTIDAWVIGEHGDACVPLFSRVEVGGSRVTPTPEQRRVAEEFLRTWYVRHVALDSGRSSTWTSGVGVARMADAIARGTGELWPASVFLAGEYGVDGVALDVPVTLGRGGAEKIHEWELAADEREAVGRAAVAVRDATDAIAAGP